jgi:hypothetical protein
MMLGTSKWTRTGGGWQPWSARKDSGRPECGWRDARRRCTLHHHCLGLSDRRPGATSPATPMVIMVNVARDSMDDCCSMWDTSRDREGH